MHIDERKLGEIVERVVARLQGGANAAPHPQRPASAPAPSPVAPPRPAAPRPSSAPSVTRGRPGIFDDIDLAVAAAQQAQHQLAALPLETRGRIIEAMRQLMRRDVEYYAREAVAETKLGRIEDKIQKNLLAANKTPGLEVLRPEAWSGDHGLMIQERAPYGVIAAITPTTNPTETILCNGIGMIAGGNAVVFNVHPGAKNISRHFVEQLNQTIVEAGGPPNLLCCLANPTVESANALMRHADTRLVVVTGGGAVVKAAMTSGKRAIAAGPGNPPVVVDETAHIEQAAKDIIFGATVDNNIICASEKEIIAVASIADQLKRHLLANGAVEVRGAQIQALERLVVDGTHPVKDWVGRDAAKIAAAIGLQVPPGTRMLMAEVDEHHPFVQNEMLMPVMGFVRVHDVYEGIEMAARVEHGFRHTAAMHSTNLDHLHTMARKADCSIFVKNAPSLAGLGYTGEGYASFTIASPTGEGLTNATHFTRVRRCTLKDYFRIV